MTANSIKISSKFQLLELEQIATSVLSSPVITHHMLIEAARFLISTTTVITRVSTEARYWERNALHDEIFTHRVASMEVAHRSRAFGGAPALFLGQ